MDLKLVFDVSVKAFKDIMDAAGQGWVDGYYDVLKKLEDSIFGTTPKVFTSLPGEGVEAKAANLLGDAEADAGIILPDLLKGYVLALIQGVLKKLLGL